VSDPQASRIWVYDSEGGLLTTMDFLQDEVGLDLPIGVAVDEAGRVYVASSNSGLVTRYAPLAPLAEATGLVSPEPEGEQPAAEEEGAAEVGEEEAAADDGAPDDGAPDEGAPEGAQPQEGGGEEGAGGDEGGQLPTPTGSEGGAPIEPTATAAEGTTGSPTAAGAGG
jgi:hypothetical protein